MRLQSDRLGTKKGTMSVSRIAIGIWPFTKNWWLPVKNKINWIQRWSIVKKKKKEGKNKLNDSRRVSLKENISFLTRVHQGKRLRSFLSFFLAINNERFFPLFIFKHFAVFTTPPPPSPVPPRIVKWHRLSFTGPERGTLVQRKRPSN